MGAYLHAADVQVVSLKDTPLLRATMPSKTQLSLAYGKPVLVHAAGDVAALVSETNAGVVAPPGDRDASVTAVRRLAAADRSEIEAMGLAARDLFECRFSPRAGIDRLEAMLHSTPTNGRTFQCSRTA
jgi:hypothetical protein